jgi:hypothetical protein
MAKYGDARERAIARTQRGRKIDRETRLMTYFRIYI